MPDKENTKRMLLFTRYPVLQDLRTNYGDISVWDYLKLLNKQIRDYGRPAVDRGIATVAKAYFAALFPEKKNLGQLFLKTGHIQTAPHLGYTLHDRMLTIVWQSHLLTPIDQPLFIGACTSVPFSNNSNPGRIWYQSQQKENLVPAKYQDTLVSSAPSSWLKRDAISNREIRLLLEHHNSERVATSMGQILSSILSTWLQREVIVFSCNDLTADIARFLIENDLSMLADCLRDIAQPALFMTNYRKGKYVNADYLEYDGNSWSSDHQSINSLTEINKKLTTYQMVPTAWLMYYLMARFLGIPPAGSYAFGGYYPKYKQSWRNKGWITDSADIPVILTTGTHPALKGKTSWDIFLNGETAKDIETTVTMRALLDNIV